MNKKKKKKNKKNEAAACRAIALLNTIRNEGHRVTTSKILNEYDLSPDDIANHTDINKQGYITKKLLERIA